MKKLLMKDRSKVYDCFFQELDDIKKVLNEKGQKTAECRYYELLSKQLILIGICLDNISTVLFLLLGLVLGKLLSGLF